MVVSENGLDGHDFLLCLLEVVLIVVVVLNVDCVVGTGVIDVASSGG